MEGATRKMKTAAANVAESLDALTARLTDESAFPKIAFGDTTALDFSGAALKMDHERRPIWVTPTGAIYLEASSPFYDEARDFLVGICEPVSRPKFIHEYRLDKHALFAAASMGMTADIIISTLNVLSKTPIHKRVADFVAACTTGYGKVKLVLHRGRYFIESAYPTLMKLLNKHPLIRAARVVYLSDGSRVVGLDSVPAEEGGAAARGEFEVVAALAETEASLGVQRIGTLIGGGGSGPGGSTAAAGSSSSGGGGAAAAVAEHTSGGALAARVAGEVDSDDEGGGGSAEAAKGAPSGARPGGAAAAGSSAIKETAASLLATSVDDLALLPVEALTELLEQLNAHEATEAMEKEAVALAEKLLAEGEAGGAAGEGGGATASGASEGSASSAADAEAAGSAGVKKLSFFADVVRRGPSTTDAPPSSSSSASRPSAPIKQDPAAPSSSSTSGATKRDIVDLTGADDTAMPPVVAATAAAASKPGGKLVLRLGGKVAATAAAAADAKPPAAVRFADDPSEVEFVDPRAAAAPVGVAPKPRPAPPAKAAASGPPAKKKRGLTDLSGVGSDEEDDDDGLGLDEDDDSDEEYGVRRRKKGGRGGAAAAAAAGKVAAAERRAAAKTAKKLAADAESTGMGGVRALQEFNAMLRALSLSSLQMTGGRVERFEVDASRVEEIRYACLHFDPPLPLVQEYDFRHDTILPRLDIGLRDTSMLRPYQEKSLAKMFGNSRARSGIIVLPCGAGKTLVGIAAACTVGKSVLVLCPNRTSVKQWEGQFKSYATATDSQICLLTSKDRQQLPPLNKAIIVITTYTMIGCGGRETRTGSGTVAAESAALMAQIRQREWGLMLLDEVHQAVANTYSRVFSLRAHCRLGLTATLVREDGRDRHLSHMVGPKLYEANWRDLTLGGYIANVDCAEVWCPMQPPFYAEYLRTRSMAAKKALAVLNPIKCAALEFLLKVHEARGDKIIVFSESIFALNLYATHFNTLALSGSTPEHERDNIIRLFRQPGSALSKIFLSKVGDVALDVPDANVIIQISSHFGSRLQEAQRMGRILRKGTGAAAKTCSFFYSLISMDTLEMYFASKRRRYLQDQGYAYRVLKAEELHPEGTLAALTSAAQVLATPAEQMRILSKVTDERAIEEAERMETRKYRAERRDGAEEDEDGEEEGEEEGEGAGGGGGGGAAASSALGKATRRVLGGMAGLSGAAGMSYLEYNAAPERSGLAALRASEEAAAAEARAAAAAARGGAGGGAPGGPKAAPARNPLLDR